MSFTGHNWRDEKLVPAGGASLPVVIPGGVRDISVKAIPGSGGTVTVQFTLDARGVIEAGNADWENWEDEDVSDPTTRALTGTVTAVRATATTEDGLLQVAGVYK